MIYDCFLFLNELDLLEIRLNELDEVVDIFVIVEFNRTFSNIPKSYYYDDNKNRFKKFHKKIRHSFQMTLRMIFVSIGTFRVFNFSLE